MRLEYNFVSVCGGGHFDVSLAHSYEQITLEHFLQQQQTKRKIQLIVRTRFFLSIVKCPPHEKCGAEPFYYFAIMLTNKKSITKVNIKILATLKIKHQERSGYNYLNFAPITKNLKFSSTNCFFFISKVQIKLIGT